MSITLAPEITRFSRPSLSCFVRHPFGLTMGDVHDAGTHRAVMSATLREAERHHAAGTIVPLPFTWTADDLRARQLRKEAL